MLSGVRLDRVREVLLFLTRICNHQKQIDHCDQQPLQNFQNLIA